MWAPKITEEKKKTKTAESIKIKGLAEQRKLLNK